MKAFVTLGLDRKPFTRLLELVDEAVERNLLDRDSLVQRGHTPYSTENFRVVDFLPFTEMLQATKEADLVITHAGVGSALLCLNAGRIPLLMPREGKRGEHVDDHQIEFAEVMVRRSKAIAAFDEKDFFACLEQAGAWCKQSSTNGDLSLEPELVKSLKVLLNNR